ncbi:efflux transporter outer membrane subunit [Pseudothauera nasutitermitis]|uniref:Efflux transporter outer membrane subunit n=2 Tax=Pseudothauera nasutitermitis TaxID=2565930 RepID=A0A4S4AUJ4_9RHOO|nr:efflux transporter outer membrane subunit [Pseudothauera nasutitermitis]THF63186.1 efflux transporter outer membrane subunit [Pseudothauera nasutitermitis]
MGGRKTLTALTVATLLAGCSLAPVYQQPEAALPAQWKQAADRVGAATAETGWRDFILDEGLRELVVQALANNRDLRQTLLDVEAARAQYRVQRADRVPGLEAQGGGTRQRVPGDLSSSGESAVHSQWQAGIGLSAFELDLFGRVRNLSQAALQEYLATEEGARAARISLMAEVVRAYLVRDGAQRRLHLIRQTLASREASLALIERRRAAGASTALDHQEALGLAEQARAELERVDREFRQAGNALRLLVGMADLALPESTNARTVLVQDIAPGVPSDLLARRPDILAAEHRLRGRNASIGAARAVFFPRIALTGLFGSASAELSDLFGSGQRAWSFSPQITLPIFDGGRNRANLDLAAVRRDIAVAAYEQTVQQAFREVADALDATATLYREEAARRTLAASSAEVLRLAEARYRAGVDSHLRYLDAQRSALANEMALAEVATQRQVALATLFSALGGGWERAEGVAGR